jgi:hypothetical protein
MESDNLDTMPEIQNGNRNNSLYKFSYKAECNCYTPDTYFNDHFKLRSELSYNKTNLEHLGQWVAPDKTRLGADQLRAMKGSTAVTNIGMQLEYFL